MIGNNPYTTHPALSSPPSSFDGTFQFLFNGNTNETTGVHTPTVNGTPTYGTGPNANNPQSIILDGSVYLDLPAHVDFSVSSFTIAFWSKRASFPSGFDAIFEHNRFGDNWYGVYASGTSGQFNIRTRDVGANPDDRNATGFSTNTWHHFITSFDDTRVYAEIDGVNVLDQTCLAGTPTLSMIRLFRNMDNGENFFGEISRMEFWNSFKNAAERGVIHTNAL